MTLILTDSTLPSTYTHVEEIVEVDHDDPSRLMAPEGYGLARMAEGQPSPDVGDPVWVDSDWIAYLED